MKISGCHTPSRRSSLLASPFSLFNLENKDYVKFRNVDLSTFDEKYALLFWDSVAIRDHIMTPLQFQNNSNPNEENVEGKGDSDDINLDDDVDPLFPSFH
ncbi:unnamed protein product [Lactuca saligna]|uniref:Uncharacterized protein n=1 Tax=Lactuca saligna TaxID=75948 RepID=A0AA35YVC9_LACSI|nr:unnamed protein product [Lactuca saligna]